MSAKLQELSITNVYVWCSKHKVYEIASNFHTVSKGNGEHILYNCCKLAEARLDYYGEIIDTLERNGSTDAANAIKTVRDGEYVLNNDKIRFPNVDGYNYNLRKEF